MVVSKTSRRSGEPSSPTTSASRPSISMATCQPAWGRPMPMWCKRPLAQSHRAGSVDPVEVQARPFALTSEATGRSFSRASRADTCSRLVARMRRSACADARGCSCRLDSGATVVQEILIAHRHHDRNRRGGDRLRWFRALAQIRDAKGTGFVFPSREMTS